MPKGCKVLGDGVTIVPKYYIHTAAVMDGRRKVSQSNYAETSSNLEATSGMNKLKQLAEASKNGRVKVWDYVLYGDLYYMAYESIKGNKGALTPGVEGDTLDTFSKEKIEEIVKAIKDHTYRFKPIRRTYIPKKDGKLRPLGIPGPADKIVQKVMAIILEAIFDNDQNPVFKDVSHGYRRGRSTHTALREITKWTNADWFIEGDIKSYFDNVNHHILAKLLEEKIDDKQFMDLY